MSFLQDLQTYLAAFEDGKRSVIDEWEEISSDVTLNNAEKVDKMNSLVVKMLKDMEEG